MHRSRRARLFALAFALIQGFASPLAAWADAHLFAEGARAAHSHVESRTSPQCARVHPVDCALCQQVATSGRVAPRVGLPVLRHATPFTVATTVRLPRARDDCCATLPRAPPLS